MATPPDRQHKNIYWDRSGDTAPGHHMLSRFHNYGYNLYYDFNFTRRGTERNDALLLVTLKGDPTLWHGDQAVFARRGAVTYYPKGSDHHYSAGLWECYFFHFYPSPALTQILAHYGVVEGRTFHNVLSEPELEKLCALYAFSKLPKELEQHRCGVLIERILYACLKDREEDLQAPARTPVENTASYIQSHPGEDLSVETLARQAHLSPSRFAHLFKERFGVSVHQFVNTARMDRACHLLKSTRMTAAQIASDLGYQTPYHFYAAFKKSTGRTALEWRHDHTQK